MVSAARVRTVSSGTGVGNRLESVDGAMESESVVSGITSRI